MMLYLLLFFFLWYFSYSCFGYTTPQFSTGLKNIFQNKEGYQGALPSLVLALPDSKTFFLGHCKVKHIC